MDPIDQERASAQSEAEHEELGRLREENARLEAELEDTYRVLNNTRHTAADAMAKAKAENAVLRKALNKLNGHRNQMANSFNAFGSVGRTSQDEQHIAKAAEMFWAADKAFGDTLAAALNEITCNVQPPKGVDNRQVRCLKCGTEFNLAEPHACPVEEKP